MVPPSAVMRPPALSPGLPPLATEAPISTTEPPPAAAMRPRFCTDAVLLSSRSKVKWLLPLSRKLASLVVMASVEATRPPTFTLAPWLNSTPLALTRKTRPLALSCPAMTDGSLPVTRLSRMLDAPMFCQMLTASLAPIEKPFQLMMARGELWAMASARPPSGVTVGTPDTVTPPCVLNMPGRKVGRTCASAGAMPMHTSDSATGRSCSRYGSRHEEVRLFMSVVHGALCRGGFVFGGLLFRGLYVQGACAGHRVSPSANVPRPSASSFISLRGTPGALRTRARCWFAADQPVL